MERNREIDEEEIQQIKEEKPQIPRNWHPSQETIQAIEGSSETLHVTPEQQEIHKSPDVIPDKEPGSQYRPSWDVPPDKDGRETGSAETATDHPDRTSRADRMLEAMMEREGKIDLTKRGAWGKFAHNAIEDAIGQKEKSRGAEASAEKTVRVYKDNGGVGKGRYDVLSEHGILEIKTHDLDSRSHSELTRLMKDTASQIEGYRWSPDIEGRPEATVFFEFPPKDPGRRAYVENFFQERGMRVMWGED
jgi:hypothetical protein